MSLWFLTEVLVKNVVAAIADDWRRLKSLNSSEITLESGGNDLDKHIE